jgi:hypothetical protein
VPEQNLASPFFFTLKKGKSDAQSLAESTRFPKGSLTGPRMTLPRTTESRMTESRTTLPRYDTVLNDIAPNATMPRTTLPRMRLSPESLYTECDITPK